MKISILAVGKLKNSPELELINEYQKRLNPKVNIIECDNDSDLIAYAKSTSCLVAMDERGQNIKSHDLAALIEQMQNQSTSELTFVIGGAEGLPKEIKEMAPKTFSFGAATWPHMLVRVMLIEQIYRAKSILRGHPYHKA